MAKESATLARVVDLLEAVELLYRNGKFLPALILSYSTIDILSSLVREDPTKDNQRKDFLQWVEGYMLPHPSIDVSAIDLYAARCGMLHALSPSSKLSRNDAAKEILYARDTILEANARRSLIAQGKHKRVAVISIPSFFDCFLSAGSKFSRALEKDPALQARFFSNERTIFRVE